MKRSFEEVDPTGMSLEIRSFYAGLKYDLANITSFLKSMGEKSICPVSIETEISQLKGSKNDPNDIEIGGVPFLNLYALWKCEVSACNFEYAMILEKVLNTSFYKGNSDINYMMNSMDRSQISAALLSILSNPTLFWIEFTIDKMIARGCSQKAFHVLLNMLPEAQCIRRSAFLTLARMPIELQPETVALVFARRDFAITTRLFNNIIQDKGQLNFITKAMTVVRPDKQTLYYAVFQDRPAELILAILDYVEETTLYIIQASITRQYDESIVKLLVDKCPQDPTNDLINFALSKGYSEKLFKCNSA